MNLKLAESYSFDGVEIRILNQSYLPDRILAIAKTPISTIEIGCDISLSAGETQVTVHKLLFNIAKSLAPKLIIDRAKEIASKIGLTPAGWRISRSRLRMLGSCNSRGIISFSPILVFVPQIIRDYIICHELTHLLQFNHSKEFHNLLNNFCIEITGLKERALKGKMYEILRDKNSLVYDIMHASFPRRGN